MASRIRITRTIGQAALQTIIIEATLPLVRIVQVIAYEVAGGRLASNGISRLAYTTATLGQLLDTS